MTTESLEWFSEQLLGCVIWVGRVSVIQKNIAADKNPKFRLRRREFIFLKQVIKASTLGPVSFLESRVYGVVLWYEVHRIPTLDGDK